jgi:type IX secretion system PorP/SprF family membrane protein
LGYNTQAQDAQFSQYYASSLYLNPAMAGIEQDFTIGTAFRSQWRGVSKPYTTNQLSAIMPLSKGVSKKQQFGGIGLSAFNDQSGDAALRSTGVNLTFAYTKSIKSDLSRFSIGGQIGVIQKSIDFKNAFWGSYYNDLGYTNPPYITESGVSSSLLVPDASLGVMWSFNPSRNYFRSGLSGYLGATAAHINRPNESLVEGYSTPMPMTIRAHGGLEFHVNSKMNVGPSFLFATQGGASQINAGGYLHYRIIDNPFSPLANSDLIIGTFYRLQDAFIFSTGITNNKLTLGLSYDMNASSLKTNTNARGAYEITLTYRNARDKKRKRFDTPRI